MKTVKINISGIVQGVFFRAFVRDGAEGFGLKGHVRNLDDGSVEVVIEGEDSKVNEMIELCGKGAPHSQVKDVKVQEIEHVGFEGFKVLRI